MLQGDDTLSQSDVEDHHNDKANHETESRNVCISIGLGNWDQLFDHYKDHSACRKAHHNVQ